MADVFILLFVLPLFLVIASLVSVYYFGVTAIWISSIFLGLAFTFMSNVTPGDLFSNNGSGASSKFPEILIPFIKGYILSALILFCAHLVFVGIRKYGIIPLVNNRYIFILAALVCAFWFWKLWSGMRIKSDYFLTEVTIYIPKDYPISLTNEMVFVGANGENTRKIQISPVYSSQLESGQRNSSLKSRYENQFYEYKTNGKLLLPVDVAEFYLSWYSFTEEVYYSDSFALNGEKVKLIKPYSVAPNTQLRNSPLDFYIYPKGKSFLTERRDSSFLYYYDMVTKGIDDNQRNEFQEDYVESIFKRTQENKQDFSSYIAALKRIDLATKYENTRKVFNWNLSLSGIKPNKVTIETLPYAPSLSRDTSQLESFNNMEFSRTGSYLPQKISILGDVDSREEGVSLAFYLDTQQLYESAVRLNGAEGGSVNFVVSVDVNNPDESIIKLAGSEKEVLFELWEVD